MDIKADWIWRRLEGAAYNDIIIAEKEFELKTGMADAMIRISADSFYRLFVNGKWVNDGPCRGWPEHYYYDQIDITDYLRPGANQIRIIACHYGIGHFHGVPRQPGLLAQINIEYTDGTLASVITDPGWQVAPAEGWSRNTPKISCQMAPAEYYDARLEQALKFEDAQVVSKTKDGPWKNIQQRDVQLLTKLPVAFQSYVAGNILERSDDSRIYCLPWARLLYPGLVQANRMLMPAFALATVIEAETNIEFQIEIVDYRDGRYFTYVDGKPFRGTVSLAAGRHLLFITHGLDLNHTTDIVLNVHASEYHFVNPYDTASENGWALLEFPQFKANNNDLNWRQPLDDYAEIMAAYRKEMQRLGAIHAEVEFCQATAEKIKKLNAEQMFAQDSYFRFINRKQLRPADSQLLQPENLLAGGRGQLQVMPADAGDPELIYDLGQQNIGYYSFELEAPAGVEIDIYAVEYISPEGLVQYPGDHRNGMTYITREGKNVFTSLKRRSGRYVFMRFCNLSEPLVIKRFELIESTYPVEFLGSFECADESLNKIWNISAHTLKLCMEDTFTDCPLYEQTFWVGDARNESLFAYGVFGATDIARRCIRLAAQSLERYPIVGCQVPSSWDCLLPAWSFIWGISIWDYYWYTKDVDFVEEMWTSILKNLHGARNFINSDGLFSADFWNLFDWAGIDQEQDTVLHNSMFMVGAIDAALKCAQILGREKELDDLLKLKKELKNTLNSYWLADEQAYPDSIHENGTISNSVSQHTSFLALLYDIAPPDKVQALLKNVLQPSQKTVKVGSPFAILYMYEMLEKFDREDSIIQSIYDSYLPMIQAGATTVWESFASGTLAHGEFPTRSHCHAWSSAPVYFLNRIVLGIRPTSPGGQAFEISPYIKDLDWAKGSYATAKGVLEVSWRKKGNTLEVNWNGPAGIGVSFRKNPTNQDCQVRLSRIN